MLTWHRPHRKLVTWLVSLHFLSRLGTIIDGCHAHTRLENVQAVPLLPLRDQRLLVTAPPGVQHARKIRNLVVTKCLEEGHTTEHILLVVLPVLQPQKGGCGQAQHRDIGAAGDSRISRLDARQGSLAKRDVVLRIVLPVRGGESKRHWRVATPCSGLFGESWVVSMGVWRARVLGLVCRFQT